MRVAVPKPSAAATQMRAGRRLAGAGDRNGVLDNAIHENPIPVMTHAPRAASLPRGVFI